MSIVIETLEEGIFTITMNRIDKHNAFDEEMIARLQEALNKAIKDSKAKVIVLQANGKHFSLGADLQWMQSTIHLNEAENIEDALKLGTLLYTLYHCPKPTIAVVQGAAYGGGAGLIAACDIAIASHNARFCFSEVKLGLIPAVISPYVIEAIGKRLAQWLFMTAQVFDAEEARAMHFVHLYFAQEDLAKKALDYARQLTENAPLALLAAKKLVRDLAFRPIDQHIVAETAKRIAHARVSSEGQLGLKAFLNKEKPKWT